MINAMNRLFLIISLFLFASCGSGDAQTKAVLPEAKKGQQTATFAAGCFWSVQEGFSELKGVIKATSGYAGGTTKNPTYEQVGSERTGHAEAVQVIYDPNVISFAQLLEAFFYMHDPTELNRQGPDIGTSYRSIAFYRNAEEKKQIEGAILKFNRDKIYGGAIVTEVKAFDTFYPAEAYHQNYYRLHPNESYVANVCGAKVLKLRKAVPQLLQDKYK